MTVYNKRLYTASFNGLKGDYNGFPLFFLPRLLTDKTTVEANEMKSRAQNVSGLKDGEGNCLKEGFLLVSRI